MSNQQQQKIIITQQEGVALAKAYLQNLKECFAANDFTTNRAFQADSLSWGWSGGVSGKGTQDEFYAVLAKTWQPLCSQFLPGNSFAIVDSHSGTIAVTFDITLILDGRGAVPINPASTWSGQNLFEMTVNEQHKVTHFRGAFNSMDAHMQAAIGAVMKATNQTPPKQATVPKEIISREDGVDLAHRLLASMRTGFAANDFSENRSLLAKNLSWDWSGNVSGKGNQDDYYKVLGQTWQPLVSQFLPTKPYVVVDTAAGVVSVSFQLVCLIDGRGTVPIDGTSTFVGDGNVFEFAVDANKKVTSFRGLWNPANVELQSAIGAVMKAKAKKAKSVGKNTGSAKARSHAHRQQTGTARRRKSATNASKQQKPASGA